MVQDSPKTRRRTSGIVVPNQPRWFQRLGAFVFVCAARAYYLTLRIRWHESTVHQFEQLSRPPIFCLWHNRLILCMLGYVEQSRKHQLGAGMAALISASKDGAFLAAILECFKVQPVRGSSSRRGPQALLELTSWAERGYSLAITPDGPRGPRYVVQHGVMSLAQLTGQPIVPFGFHARRKIQLKSWDRFQIPLPFTRCDLQVGPALHVPREATDAQREELRLQLEQMLKNLSPD